MKIKQEYIIVRKHNGPYSLRVREVRYDDNMVLQAYGEFKKVPVELMIEEEFNNKYPQRKY